MNPAIDTSGPGTLQGRPLWRRLPGRTVLYLLAAVFLAIVLWRSKFWDSGDAIGRLDAVHFVAVPLISLALVLPLALRQRAILAALGRRFSLSSVAPITYYGNTVGFLTPAASGELLRPTLFERTFGVPIAQGVGLVLYERLYSIFLFGLGCLVALAWTDTIPRSLGIVVTPVLLTACLLPALVVRLSSVMPLGRVERLLPHRIRERVSETARESGSTLERLFTSPRLTGQFIVLSAVIFVTMAAQFWLIQDGLGESLTLQEAWVVLAASAMAGVASGLPLGIGATDAVMLSLLRAYGVDTSTAGTIVILTRVLINLPSGLFGLAAYLIALRQGSASEPRVSAQKSVVVAAGGDE
jgi:uncharacterized protein (TIRG00374 family)